MNLDQGRVRTPGGNYAEYLTRPDANDAAVAVAIVGTDEYRLGTLRLAGWMLDIGAHIGSVAIAAALDNPDLRVVAVEPLAENAEIVRQNVALNGLDGRVFVEEAGAAGPDDSEVTVTYGYRSVGGITQPAVDAAYLHDCRWIGNIFQSSEQDGEIVTVPAISLDAILAKYGIDRVALIKIDCEGCEWQFLTSPAMGRVDRIVGEYHDAKSWDDLAALLAPTHIAEQWTTGEVGLFSAVLR